MSNEILLVGGPLDGEVIVYDREVGYKIILATEAPGTGTYTATYTLRPSTSLPNMYFGEYQE